MHVIQPVIAHVDAVRDVVGYGLTGTNGVFSGTARKDFTFRAAEVAGVRFAIWSIHVA